MPVSTAAQPIASNQMSATAVAGHRSSLLLHRAVLVTRKPRGRWHPRNACAVRSANNRAEGPGHQQTAAYLSRKQRGTLAQSGGASTTSSLGADQRRSSISAQTATPAYSLAKLVANFDSPGSRWARISVRPQARDVEADLVTVFFRQIAPEHAEGPVFVGIFERRVDQGL